MRKVVVSRPVLEVQADVATAASMPIVRLGGRGGAQERMVRKDGALWMAVDGGLAAAEGVFWASRPPCPAPLVLLLRRAQKGFYRA